MKAEVRERNQLAKVDTLNPTKNDELTSKLTDYFRHICMAFQPREGVPGHRIIGFTSSVRGEGVTTIALGVAKCLATEMLSRVLYIECDRRHPTIHQLLDMPPEPGFSNLLAGPVEIEQVIRRTQFEELAVIPAGKDSGYSLLIRPQRFISFLETLRNQVDYIIMDLPPVVADPACMSIIDLADAVYLIVKAGTVPSDIVRSTAEKLSKANFKGTILNGKQTSLPSWLERLF